MPTFGENLRREREMRGVTLQEIGESTKISLRLLRAIEEDHFSELPGGVFTRSFIRSYARYLGLDEEHVLAEYKRMAQPATDNDLARFVAPKPLALKSGPPMQLVPWVVAAVLLAGGYILYRAHRAGELLAGSSAAPPASSSSATSGPAPLASPASNSSAQTSTSASAERAPENPASPPSGTGAASGTAGEASPGDQQSSGDQQAALASNGAAKEPPVGSPAVAPATGEGDLVLQVATTEEVWLAVQADGKTLLQRVLPPNSVQTFRAKDSFDVTTGNAQGTILTLNGETQKPLGRHGEFKKIHLARDDFGNHAP
jgi:cytoskeleton protein RodZ